MNKHKIVPLEMSAMVSFPVMLFLITLLLPAMHPERRNQKEPTTSAEHEKNLKAVVDKIDSQSERNITESLERTFSDSHQDQKLFENRVNQPKVNLSRMLNILHKCSAQNHQVETVNFRRMPHRIQATKLRYHQNNYKKQVLYSVDEFLTLVRNELISKYV
ncbi:hemoglobin subunit alpha-like [Grammomys surdaster]|uniref:hemoglobin subunit alpha-like n=1 Tax=Grammomys surdaster TaxID=491861 RepID=UPI0010A092EF|nr:hemoglobin subunit alpha-like [Grammomys surdaster]